MDRGVALKISWLPHYTKMDFGPNLANLQYYFCFVTIAFDYGDPPATHFQRDPPGRGRSAVFLLALGALATQSCESTDGRDSYYNRGPSGYYHDGRYAEDTGYYRERRYNNGDSYESDRPTINLHF